MLTKNILTQSGIQSERQLKFKFNQVIIGISIGVSFENFNDYSNIIIFVCSSKNILKNSKLIEFDVGEAGMRDI